MFMDPLRRKQLQKNGARMFWIRAFLNLKILNIVISLFFLHRGLTLSQIFYLAAIWSIGGLLFEIPSSYLADRWGRKKTIVLGVLLMLSQWVVFLVAQGFLEVAIGMVFYAFSFACFSGTDEALVYDTQKELGEEKGTLKHLSRYKSAQSALKIISSIVGAVIAKDLLGWQFQALIGIDIVASLIALVIALCLVEPDHHMDVEKLETGVFVDGVQLIKNDRPLMLAILNKQVLFFATLIPFLYYQQFFHSLGISIITIGVAWGVRHGIVFLWHWFVGHTQSSVPLVTRINRLNQLFLVVIAVFIALLFAAPIAPLLFFLYLAFVSVEAFRFPLFSELFHKRFHSYNRATTLSLSNLMHNVIEIPLVFFAGFIIALDPRYPFVFCFLLGVIVVFFLSLPSKSFSHETTGAT